MLPEAPGVVCDELPVATTTPTQAQARMCFWDVNVRTPITGLSISSGAVAPQRHRVNVQLRDQHGEGYTVGRGWRTAVGAEVLLCQGPQASARDQGP